MIKSYDNYNYTMFVLFLCNYEPEIFNSWMKSTSRFIIPDNDSMIIPDDITASKDLVWTHKHLVNSH
ncbi:MAG: hypothetical protein GY932_13480 [Arcobacter sp.]|nr:hypothetical protein [Arcobacter sp.]